MLFYDDNFRVVDCSPCDCCDVRGQVVFAFEDFACPYCGCPESERSYKINMSDDDWRCVGIKLDRLKYYRSVGMTETLKPITQWNIDKRLGYPVKCEDVFKYKQIPADSTKK